MTPPPRLVPDRPSDAAIAQALCSSLAIDYENLPDFVLAHAREIDAAAPPAEAPAERGALLAAVEEFFDRGEMDRDLDTPAERLLRNAMVRARDELGAAPAAPAGLISVSMDDAPPCPVWLVGKDVSHGWAAGWSAASTHYGSSTPRGPGGREDSDLLDFMQNERVALIPEFEGGWDVEVFDDAGNSSCIGSGHTPRDALNAALQAATGGADHG